MLQQGGQNMPLIWVIHKNNLKSYAFSPILEQELSKNLYFTFHLAEDNQ
jgi:hypothetical protein